MSEIEKLHARQDAMERRQDRVESIHVETMAKLGDLVTELKVSNANAAHRDKEVDSLKSEMKEVKATQSKILQQQSENKPMIDIVKGLNARIWALIVTAIGGALGTIAVIAGQVK